MLRSVGAVAIACLLGACAADPPLPREPDKPHSDPTPAPAAPVNTAADGDDAGPIAAAPSTDSRGPTVAIHTRTDLPVKCNADQTNTPCIFHKGQGCRLRYKNCEHLPCTERAPEPIACDRAVGALPKTAPVCLEVRDLPHDATIAVFRNDSTSEVGAGPLGDSVAARVCGGADRVWNVGVTAGGATFDSTVDWRRASCFTVDLGTSRITERCAPSTGGAIKSYEGRL